MLTILLATRNRARILRDVLETYCQLQSPASGWKLVVVDNGSTDQTAQVVASFANRLPLHYLLEPTLGKNCALNAGLALVEGDLTVFTDDDVFPNAEWLVKLRQAADANASYSMFGGVILPRWEAPPPKWIRWIVAEIGRSVRNSDVKAGPVYSLTDGDFKEGQVDPCLIFGPNMAVRTSIFRSGIHFDTSIGPRGSSYAMGSETELLLRLGRYGHKAWYVQDAIVEHFVRAEQLEKAWVLPRAVRFGRGQYRLSRGEKVTGSKLWLGLPRYLLRDIPKEGVSIAVAWVIRKEEALFRSHWRFNYLRGVAIEAFSMARETSASSTFPIAT